VGYRSRKPAGDAHVTAAVRGDLGTPTGANKAVAEALRALGGSLDILVINHGVWPADDVPVAKMTNEQWGIHAARQPRCVIYVCRAAIPTITEGGTIVLVRRPPAARRGVHADYAATKGAVISLTKSLRGELAPRSRSTGGPGWVDTEMSAKPYAGAGSCGDRENDSVAPGGQRRGRGGSDSVSLFTARQAHDGRDSQRERGFGPLWLSFTSRRKW